VVQALAGMGGIQGFPVRASRMAVKTAVPAKLPEQSLRTPASARDLGPPRRSGLRLLLERRDL